MGLKPVSKSKFLDKNKGRTAPKPAAEKDPVLGGDALVSHEARQKALKQGPQIDSVPKVTTGPKAATPTFSTLRAADRRAP